MRGWFQPQPIPGTNRISLSFAFPTKLLCGQFSRFGVFINLAILVIGGSKLIPNNNHTILVTNLGSKSLMLLDLVLNCCIKIVLSCCQKYDRLSDDRHQFLWRQSYKSRKISYRFFRFAPLKLRLPGSGFQDIHNGLLGSDSFKMQAFSIDR